MFIAVKQQVFADWQELSLSRYQLLVAGLALRKKRLPGRDVVQFQVTHWCVHMLKLCATSREIARLVIAGFGRY
jgi:hypothetical protein